MKTSLKAKLFLNEHAFQPLCSYSCLWAPGLSQVLLGPPWKVPASLQLLAEDNDLQGGGERRRGVEEVACIMTSTRQAEAMLRELRHGHKNFYNAEAGQDACDGLHVHDEAEISEFPVTPGL